MAVDSGIVTIYDLENNGNPLQCHRIDAKQFLKSPRWSATPYAEIKGEVGERPDNPELGMCVDPQGLDPIQGDTGETMRLKEMSFKALQAMASKAGIPDYQNMKKGELVEALAGGTDGK